MSATKRARPELNRIDEAIERHDGDPRAIENCRFLRDQLDTARYCMSSGLTRGWKPGLDR
ncbi:hypothetical protein ELH23_13490 [Rhizobium ruizarguesonis]|nr:hypothetical protein ELH86_12505 [Rhizobium ruizarguesonis]TBD21822.1 hypothetical protein ELH23_13490 [Rhizobium ruizarguesonis]